MIAFEEFSRLLVHHFSPVASLSDQQIRRLYGHYEFLEAWNKKLNLTAIRDAEEIVVRHYCESLFLGTLLSAEPVSVADVGSGAGFPGIPMAILRLDCRFTLIESHQRKAVFLRESCRGLPNVQVLAKRAEQVDTHFDWAVCRAVNRREVLPIMTHLAKQLGFLTSEEEAAELAKSGGMSGLEAVRLPWGDRRVAIVSRGT